MYEGAPNWPECDRFWKIIDDHKVTVFYTAPTAIRAFTKWGNEWVRKHSLASLRLLGTVGEPINPEAWMWFHREIGKERCPIVDTWWQTETGAIMIAPMPGAVPTKPGSATRPFFGIVPEMVTKEGNLFPTDKGGLLVIRKPWPSMARTIYGDPSVREAYWSEIPGSYFTGDGARRDADGYYWLMGRVDDVHQRQRPPPRHDGSRIGARRASQGRRGCRGRPSARDEGPGDLPPSSRSKSGHQPSEELRQEIASG